MAGDNKLYNGSCLESENKMSLHNLAKRLEKTINSGISYCFSDFVEKTEKQINKIEKYSDGIVFVDKLKNKIAKLAYAILANRNFDNFVKLFTLNDIEVLLYPQTKDFRKYIESKYDGVIRSKKENEKITVYFFAFSGDESRELFFEKENSENNNDNN